MELVAGGKAHFGGGMVTAKVFSLSGSWFYS